MAREWELGEATITPATGTAGEWGTWVVSYRVGAAGLAVGAAVRVQLPETWHVWYRNSSHGTQSTDPAADNYVTARCAKPGVELACTVIGGTTDEYVKANRRGLDDRERRYAFVTEVQPVVHIANFEANGALGGGGQAQPDPGLDVIDVVAHGLQPVHQRLPFVANGEDADVIDAQGHGGGVVTGVAHGEVGVPGRLAPAPATRRAHGWRPLGSVGVGGPLLLPLRAGII